MTPHPDTYHMVRKNGKQRQGVGQNHETESRPFLSLHSELVFQTQQPALSLVREVHTPLHPLLMISFFLFRSWHARINQTRLLNTHHHLPQQRKKGTKPCRRNSTSTFTFTGANGNANFRFVTPALSGPGAVEGTLRSFRTQRKRAVRRRSEDMDRFVCARAYLLH